MEITYIEQPGYSFFDNCNFSHNDISNILTIPESEFSFTENQILEIPETDILVKIFERVFVTNEGIVHVENIINADETESMGVFNRSLYEWSDLLLYRENNKIYVICKE